MLQVSHAILFLCFRIIDIDDNQTVRLAEDEGGAPVKVRYPYEQLKPYVIPFAGPGPSSGDRLDFFDDLHISPTTGAAVAAEPVPLETNPAPSISLSTGVAVAAESSPPPVISLSSDVDFDSIPLSTDVAGADSIVAAESTPPVISLSSDVDVNSIPLSTDVWIGDDHIDHCQGLLLKQFPATKGLQNKMLFGTHDACNVGAPDGEFLNFKIKHKITLIKMDYQKYRVPASHHLWHQNSTKNYKSITRMVCCILPHHFEVVM